jgi:hypothetical protein
MLRHAVAGFFWISALFLFVLSLRGELVAERDRRRSKPSQKH